MDNKSLEKLRTEEFISYDLAVLGDSEKWKKYARLIANAMGSIPWVGTILSLAAAKSSDKASDKTNQLFEEWLRVHKEKIGYLLQALDEVSQRLDNVHETIVGRIESEEYLTLVRRAFRSWDNAETSEKRNYIVNLISNAAATSLCPDDMIRLFNDWLDSYHEAHFRVIREIYKTPGITRANIWKCVSGEFPREDSAEADLFRLLIRDLSTGGVIRQSDARRPPGSFYGVVQKVRSEERLHRH